MEVSVLRELFRNYQSWYVLATEHGVDTLHGPDGTQYNFWDIQYLYEQTHRLPTQQRRAIELCLIQGMRETDAAVAMGVSPTNPVAMYATAGLKKLCTWVDDGTFDRSEQRMAA
jgi:DNA-directed RNA polymerase specialized sigma24 family protein